MPMAVRAEWDQLLRIGPQSRCSWSSWLAPGATETSGVVSPVGHSSRLSKPSFWGESGGHPSKTLLVILRFLLIWPFWVCMTTDIGNFYYVITAPLLSDRNQNACDDNRYLLGVTRCGGIICRVRSRMYSWIHVHSASLQCRVCHDS